MITIQTKPRLSLHEAVIAEVKAIYGDVPVQLAGTDADLSIDIDPLFDSLDLQAHLKTAVNGVFAARGVGVDVKIINDSY